MANPQKENGFTPIANEIIEALCQINLSAYESRIVWFILRKTYGWQKKEDRISLAQFSKTLHLAKTHLCRAIKRLVKRKIITQIGNGYYVTYSFQKDYHRWELLPNQVTITSKGNEPLPKEVIPITFSGNAIYTKETNTKERKKGILSKSPKPDCLKCKGTGFVYDEQGVFKGKCSCKE